MAVSLNADWSPIPHPAKPSRFYNLKSCAFSRHTKKDLGAGSLHSARRGPGASASSLPPVSGSLPSAASAASLPKSEDDDPTLQKLLKRRDAALAESLRAEAEFSQESEKLRRERGQREAATARARGLQDRSKDLRSELRAELDAIYAHQKRLKMLRGLLKEAQADPSGACRSAEILRAAPCEAVRRPPDAATPKSAEAVRAEPVHSPDAVDATGRCAALADWAARAGSRGSRRTASARSSSPDEPPDVAAGPSRQTPAFGEGRAQAATDDVQRAAAAMSPGRRVGTADSPASQSDTSMVGQPLSGRLSIGTEDEAEIELLRPSGFAFARLRHPGGAEALVDLQSGHVLSWQLGNAVVTAAVPSLRLVEPGSSLSQWRLTYLDDSNNEPSMTLSCGEPGAYWRASRTVKLGADGLQERLVFENFSAQGVSVSVREELANMGAKCRQAVETAQAMEAIQAAPALLSRPSVRVRRVGSPSGRCPAVAVVPPRSSWAAQNAWALETVEVPCTESPPTNNR